MDSLGLYLHIPFCSFMCHYCDFAKTANFDTKLQSDYVDALIHHLHYWKGTGRVSSGFSSIYLGGGTPSLLSKELLARLFAELTQVQREGAEITLEANPNDCTEDALRFWKSLGINRLSLGVQTLQKEGLRFLTRDHGAGEALQALENCSKQFSNYSADLMYGWVGQTLGLWKKDLEQLTVFPLTHLSLYNLTYASHTPMGRAKERGKIQPEDEAVEESYYLEAQAVLAKKGFVQDEVSNWAKPGFSSQHNLLYWTGGYFLGLGSGAYSYLPQDPIGLRFSYPRNERIFAKAFAETDFPGAIFEERTLEMWLMEYVGCGLRQKTGIDLQKIKAISGFEFRPTPLLEEALQNGKLRLVLPENRVFLAPREWFRETSWCTAVLAGFTKNLAI